MTTAAANANSDWRGMNWMLTKYPKPEDDFKSDFDRWCLHPHIKYLTGQVEICPSTGREHYQMYVELTTTKRMTGIKKIFGSDVHCELRRGTQLEAVHYCQKKETRKPGTDFFFSGTLGVQGARTDLTLIKEQIEKGELSVEQVALGQPELYHQYGRTLSKIEDLLLRKKFRTEMTKGIWYYGTTGVGKSHKAMENFHPDTHYVWKLNDRGWQDGYTQQKTVIINDFRGEISFGELLTLVDKWPHTVPRRGREPMPFISETVIITSCKHPHEIYHRSMEDKDKLEQLDRRFEIIELKKEPIL